MDSAQYQEWLNSPLWQKRRLQILERDNYRCTWCSDKDHQLHVHHKYYLDDRYPWEYEDDALVTVCDCCHKKYHFMDWMMKKAYDKLKDEIGKDASLTIIDDILTRMERATGRKAILNSIEQIKPAIEIADEEWLKDKFVHKRQIPKGTIVCKHCGLLDQYHVVEQLFGNGKIHHRGICDRCDQFIQYVKQKKPITKILFGQKYRYRRIDSMCSEEEIQYLQWALRDLKDMNAEFKEAIENHLKNLNR